MLDPEKTVMGWSLFVPSKQSGYWNPQELFWYAQFIVKTKLILVAFIDFEFEAINLILAVYNIIDFPITNLAPIETGRSRSSITLHVYVTCQTGYVRKSFVNKCLIDDYIKG